MNDVDPGATYARAAALMARIAPELPALRAWMLHMETTALMATTGNRPALLSGWQRAQTTIMLLIDVVGLYQAAATPAPLRLAYEHARPQLRGIESRITQLEGHLAYASLRGAGIGTSTDEQQRVKHGYGEAKHALDVLVELLITYHVAANAVYGGGIGTPLAALLLLRREPQGEQL